MTAYLLRRLLSLSLSLIAASLVIFLVMEVVPGDPASFMMGINADPQAVAALRTQLGLDQPLPLRYLGWVAGLLQGDFGISYTYRVPVSELIAERVVISLPLTLYALALSTLIAFPAGILAASRRNSAADLSVMGATQLGVAIPNFWFAMLLVLVFAVNLRWFSAGGFPGWEAGFWAGDEGAVAAGDRARLAAGGDPGPGHAFLADRHAGRGLSSAPPAPRGCAARRCGGMRCATR
jgi:peptide/nickel transport system permease protein